MFYNWHLVEHSLSLSLSKHPACMLPHFAFITCHGPSSVPHRTSNLQPIWMIYFVNTPALPPSSATTLATCILAPPHKQRSLVAADLLVAFVKIFLVPSALACISPVPISRWSKRRHHEMASCWRLSKHPHFWQIAHWKPYIPYIIDLLLSGRMATGRAQGHKETKSYLSLPSV
jgi:hypothetical protein